MRMGVLDIGSTTVRLVVADAGGALPLPVHTAKRRLRLADHVGPDRELPPEQVARIVDAVVAARAEGALWGVDQPLAFATAIVRDAPNRDEVLRAVRAGSGVALHTLSGETEAELTFLAARRWMGWQAGPLVMLDIGGGSLEVAFGRSRMPDYAVSLPLGAGLLTRDFFGDQDPPSRRACKAVRRHARHQLRDAATRIRWEGPRTAVATSRTFQQLGRLCGAPPGRFGPFVPRHLSAADLRLALPRLRRLTTAERAGLPGISPARSWQSLAGALVAHTAMALMNIDRLTICPWGLRDGVLLRCIEEGNTEWWFRTARGEDPPSGAETPALQLLPRG
ncbi:Ppx/GppA family phosphatase [Streptomyces sp. CAU 1734]|uniref:Ppx/GppA phosphatase family protein n=1 Tax=Streptomyces sp. CAU 1734 TaxID=3140360 RepID=UPI003260C3B9